MASKTASGLAAITLTDSGAGSSDVSALAGWEWEWDRSRPRDGAALRRMRPSALWVAEMGNSVFEEPCWVARRLSQWRILSTGTKDGRSGADDDHPCFG